MFSYPQNDTLSASEYLRVEEAAPEKHEYVAGRLFAMSGATAAHNAIVSNLNYSLFPVAKQCGCTSFIADMKVKVEALGNFYYPDIMISCERWQPRSVFLTAPCVVFEVLSPSTMQIDRREKLMAYRTISTLTEYVLVYQDQRRVELNRKDQNGEWQCHVYEGSDSMSLTSIGTAAVNLGLDSIYDGIDISVHEDT